MNNHPRTANDYVQLALRMMQTSPPQYLAASCVLRFLYQHIASDERHKLARLLVQCGVALHDNDLMGYVAQISLDDATPQLQLARFMMNTSLHHTKQSECRAEVTHQPPFSLPSTRSWDDCILVCAGGEKLMKQLYCNLKSIELFEQTKKSWPSLENIPIVVAHAAEISAAEADRFKSEFYSLNLVFFDLAETALVLESHLTAPSLRGFQIKLAAVVAIPARRVLLMDADLFWLIDPRTIIAKCRADDVDAHLFCDFWHFVERRHEKSSSTSFLYSIHGLEFDRSEFESGVVFIDRERTYKSIGMLRHMILNYEYYFSLTFGDKDLYYLALKSQDAKVTISDIPKMLGCVYDGQEGRERDLFYSQSMLQLFDSKPCHIHTTLHPVGDDDFDIPTHICENGALVHFVQRRLGNKNVGTVACEIHDATPLETPNLYRSIYLAAQRDLKTFNRTVR